MAATKSAPNRDQLAAMAMQGLASDPDDLEAFNGSRSYPRRLARAAYLIADAMLDERKRQAEGRP